jgi:hypothetical protein
MSAKDPKTAYVVPTILWDRITKELKELKEKYIASPQSGGAVIGLDNKGNVDASALLKNFAIQQTIVQNPKSSVIGLLDQWTRQALDNPNLSASEKVHLMGSLNLAQQDQLKAARMPTASSIKPSVKPNPNTASSSSFSRTPTSRLPKSITGTRSLPPPYESPATSSSSRAENAYDTVMKMHAKKIKNLQSQPSTPEVKRDIARSEKRIKEIHERKAALRQHPKPKKLFTPSK